MVSTNNIMINENILNKKIKENIKNVLNNNLFWYDINGKNIFNEKQKNRIMKNIMKEFSYNMNGCIHNSIDYNYCIHKYRNGKNTGKYCMAKVRIESNDNKNKFLCSRHCRNYNSNERNYSKRNRCKHIRDNGIQCKHFSNNKTDYCYIHCKDEKEEENRFIFNSKHILKLNLLRNIYYKKLKYRKKKLKKEKQNKKENNKKNDKKIKLNTNDQNAFYQNNNKNNINYFDNPDYKIISRTLLNML